METKKKIEVKVSWAESNFGAYWSEENIGAVVVTGKTLPKLKHNFSEAFQFNIEGCKEDGIELPSYLTEGNYEIIYVLDTVALLKESEEYVTLKAVSKASGINERQLSRYASGATKPQPSQRLRIKEGLARIAMSLSALTL